MTRQQDMWPGNRICDQVTGPRDPSSQHKDPEGGVLRFYRVRLFFFLHFTIYVGRQASFSRHTQNFTSTILISVSLVYEGNWQSSTTELKEHRLQGQISNFCSRMGFVTHNWMTQQMICLGEVGRGR